MVEHIFSKFFPYRNSISHQKPCKHGKACQRKAYGEHPLHILHKNNIDVCVLQETEIPKNFPENVLSCGGFILELEQNTDKKRAGIYLRNGVKYTRRHDLEKEDYHILIVDVLTHVKIRNILLKLHLFL